MSKNRQLSKNLLFNLGTFGINLLLTFFMTPFLIKSVGKEAYGFYPLINNMVNYTTIISTAVGSMGGRFITMAYYKGEHKEAQAYFNSIIFANWMLSLLFSLIFAITLFYLPYILQIPGHLLCDVRWLFGLSGVALIIGLCFNLYGIGTYVKNRIDLSSSRTMIGHVVNAVFIVVLFCLFKPRIPLISLAAVIGAIVVAYLNIKLKKQLLPELKLNPLAYYDYRKIKELTSSGVWNSLNQLSNLLLNHLDLLIANIFISAAATGDYAIVKVAPGLIFSFLIILSSTFIPSFNILYAKGEKQLLIKEIQKAMKIVCILICIPIGFLLVFADQFFHLWVPSMDSEYLYWLSFITVAPLIFGASINPVFGAFSITNRLKLPSIVLLGTGVMSTIAVYLLLKMTTLGLWSIPLVAAIQQIVRNCFFTPIYAARCLSLKSTSFYPTILKCCLCLFVIVCIGWIVKQSMRGDTWLWLVIEGLVVLVIGFMANVYIIMNRQERAYLTTKIQDYCGIPKNR